VRHHEEAPPIFAGAPISLAEVQHEARTRAFDLVREVAAVGSELLDNRT